MSESPRSLEDEADTQMSDVQNETLTAESLPIDETAEDEELETAAKDPAKKREKKQAAPLEREPGKTLFPISRVQKIIKLDKELPIVAKDATLAIALATEMFIQQLCEAGYSVAHGESRSTVQPKDISAIIRRADEFLFLEDTLPWLFGEPLTKKSTKPKEKKEVAAPRLNTSGPMDQFLGNKDNGEEVGVIMNEDGTMSAVRYDENDFDS